MIRSLFSLALLSACAGAPSEPTSSHDEAHAHEHAAPTVTIDVPSEVALGAYRGQLESTSTGLSLQVTDASGEPVVPTGEVRVQLTGTGEEAQRVVLTPEGALWTGEARTSGADGYVAVVSLELDGHTESGRFAWGEVPAPAHEHDEAHGHAHGDDAGHGHAH